jgi:DME family drug/metabolite transporter
MSESERDQTWRPSANWGRLLVLTATLLWSLNGFFGQSPVFSDWPAENRGILLSFWRSLFAAVMLWPFVRQPRWTPRLLPMMGCFVLMGVTLLSAMSFTSAASAIWLHYTSPLWVFLGGVCLLRERATWRDACMLLNVSAGILFILSYAGSQDWRGVTLGLASGVTFAGVVLSLRLLRGQNSAWLIALNTTASAVLLFPYVMWHGIWPDLSQLGVLCAFGMLQIGLPYLLFTLGLRGVTSHEASAMTLLEPLLVPCWVWLAWRHVPSYEPTHWSTFVGGAFILSGLAIRFISPQAITRVFQRHPAELPAPHPAEPNHPA